MFGSTYISNPIFKKIISNQVFKNFSYLTVGTVFSQLISLISILETTRLLVPQEYGLFSFLIAQGLLLSTISSLGMSITFVRRIARDPSNSKDLFFNGMFLRSGAMLVLTSLYALYNYYLGSLTLVQIALLFVLTFINCLYDISENIFHGNQRMLPPSIITLVYSLLWFTIIYSLPSGYNNVNILILLYLIANAIKAGISIWVLKSQNLLKGTRNNFLQTSKKLVNEGWPYFVMILVMLPISSLSNNFLDLNSNIEEVGYFNLAQRVVAPLSLVFSIVFTAIFPNLSALWIDNEQRFYHVVCFGFKYFMLFALTFCFLFNLFAHELITFLFPAKYFHTIAISKVQVWYLFLSLVNSLIGTILGAFNKEKLILRFAVISSLICTPVLFYVSQFGALGLTYGYVISFAISLVYVWHIFKKQLKFSIQHGSHIWLLAILLFLISYFLPSELPVGYKLILSVPIMAGVGLYFSKTYSSILAK